MLIPGFRLLQKLFLSCFFDLYEIVIQQCMDKCSIAKNSITGENTVKYVLARDSHYM